MLAGQRQRVTPQLLKAEQLRAQQLRIPVMPRRMVRARRKSENISDYDSLLTRVESDVGVSLPSEEKSPGLVRYQPGFGRHGVFKGSVSCRFVHRPSIRGGCNVGADWSRNPESAKTPPCIPETA